MKFLSKIRFLPVMIFFAVMMLTVKINNIWSGLDSLDDAPIEVAGAVAQTQDQVVDEPQEEGVEEPVDEGLADEGTDGAFEEEEETSRLITDDPTLLTPAEIELLQHLAVRRDELNAREQELDMREGLLRAAESRIDKKIAELEGLRETISGLIKTFDEQQDQKLQSLVKIYENMKPKEAARIFEDLELDTLLEVAERMKERKLAPIMAKMDPQKAREMTVELRQLRELPNTGSNTGG